MITPTACSRCLRSGEPAGEMSVYQFLYILAPCCRLHPRAKWMSSPALPAAACSRGSELLLANGRHSDARGDFQLRMDRRRHSSRRSYRCSHCDLMPMTGVPCLGLNGHLAGLPARSPRPHRNGGILQIEAARLHHERSDRRDNSGLRDSHGQHHGNDCKSARPPGNVQGQFFINMTVLAAAVY